MNIGIPARSFLKQSNFPSANLAAIAMREGMKPSATYIYWVTKKDRHQSKPLGKEGDSEVAL